MTHVILSEMSGSIAHAIREDIGGGVEQEACCLNNIAGYANRSGFLFMHFSVIVCIDNARHYSGFVMIDLDGHRIGSKLKMVRLFRFGDLRV